jgi:hypothetical protein
MGRLTSGFGGCRSRRCLEGRISRRRHYACRKCGQDFIADTSRSLPEGARICQKCTQDPKVWDEYQRAFAEKEILVAI